MTRVSLLSGSGFYYSFDHQMQWKVILGRSHPRLTGIWVVRPENCCFYVIKVRFREDESNGVRGNKRENPRLYDAHELRNGRYGDVNVQTIHAFHPHSHY